MSSLLKKSDLNALKQFCPIQCPGCKHRNLDKSQSEAEKESWIRNHFQEWLTQKETLIAPIRGAIEEKRWKYRKKSTLHAGWDEKLQKWNFGFQILKKEKIASVKRFDYELLPIPQCPVHTDSLNRWLDHLSQSLPDPSLFPLVAVVISGEIMTLVLKTSEKPKSIESSFLTGLQLLGVKALWLNLNPVAGNRILFSKGWEKVWGESEVSILFETYPEKTFLYGPDTFSQLIPELYFDSLHEVLNFFNLEKNSKVVDLYSGIGISISNWKQRTENVIGVELGGESIRCSEKNLGMGICLRGRCSDRIPQIQEWLEKNSSVQGEKGFYLYANPPRLGLEVEVVNWIVEISRPKKIAYLSCSPGTLKRDLKKLTQSGYQLEKIIPFDFFPQTHHLECLALLSLRG